MDNRSIPARPRQRSLALVFLVALIALVLAACDGESTATSVEAETATTRASTTTVAPSTTIIGGCPEVFCVKYFIRPEATWADGAPVTAEDFAFTYETIMRTDLDIASRTGYSQITGYEIVDDKTVVFAFGEVYAPWRTLFGRVLPAHALEGQSFETIWDEAITLGSGPFRFSEWIPDERIVLTRDPGYWGTTSGDVQTVDIVFPEDLEAEVRALRDGEVDVIYPQPQVEVVEDLTSRQSIEWEAGSDLVWEHFDFNQDDKRLQNLYVRQAIAQAINRDAILEQIIRPIGSDPEPLGNSVWLNTNAQSEDHFNQRFPYDPEAAEGLLVDNGCLKGADGIYVCDGERMSFTWTTTTGNEARELQFELAAADLQAIGIEVTAKFGPANEVFSDANFYGGAGSWQILNFAWVGDPDPVGQNTLYHCEGDAPNGFGALNNLRYCDEQVDSLIRETDGQVDFAERAATYNEADELWLAGIPMIPIYQKPTFLAWNSVLDGPKDNASEVGPFWNLAEWTGKEDVIFGAGAEPLSLNVLERDGNMFVTGLVSTAVLEGAYTITPDFQFVPQLITRAEPMLPTG
jgi:peptide/nickel transport system substrate-binding protein